MCDAFERSRPTADAIAGRMWRRLPAHASKDDMVAAAHAGLLDALRKLGPEADGPAAAAYIEVRVRGAVIDELRRLDWVPRRTRHNAAREGRSFLFVGLDAAGECVVQGSEPVAAPSDDDGGRAGSDDLMRLLGHAPATADCQAALAQARARLAPAVAALPERERRIIVMRFIEDMSVTQISAIEKVTEARISQLTARALRLLREALAVGEY